VTTVEVKQRDGLARIAEWSLGERDITLPAVEETLSLFPGLAESRMENVPLCADADFAGRYLAPGSCSPIRVHPAVRRDVPSGTCVLVPCWHTALANPRKYVEWLIGFKDSIPPDTVFYAPATALPSNLALLCYSGFDLFDFTAVDLMSARGLVCRPEGTYPAAAWAGGDTPPSAQVLSDLNRAMLLRELELVRFHIRTSSLRDLLESRCRMDASQVAVLRLLDRERSFLEKWVPVSRPGPLRATTGEALTRVEVARFAERVVTRYRPPNAGVAVLLPCSAKKPYSHSQSHRKFAMAICGRALELIVTSPLGLVPRDLERVYPAAHYDVPVTGYWDGEEKARIREIIARFFQNHRFRRVIAHLDGGALEVAQAAAGAAGIDLEVTCERHPLSPPSLRALDEALSGQPPVTHDSVRATASYQFDQDVDTAGLFVKARFPELRVFRGKDPIFSLDPSTGLLRPTFRGWDLIPEGYRVHIDAFVPTGDILVPGVIDADPRILEGDEVLVTGPQAIATGRAAMSADEMLRSRRGVAVRVRKVKMTGDQNV